MHVLHHVWTERNESEELCDLGQLLTFLEAQFPYFLPLLPLPGRVVVSLLFVPTVSRGLHYRAWLSRLSTKHFVSLYETVSI